VALLRLVQDYHGRREGLTPLITLALVSVLLASSAGGAFIGLLPVGWFEATSGVDGMRTLLLCFGIGVPLVAMSRLVAVLLQANHRMGEAAMVFHVVRAAAVVLMSAAGYAIRPGLAGVACGTLAGFVLVFGYSLWRGAARLGFDSLGRHLSWRTELFRYAYPILLSGIGFQVFTQYDRFLVARDFPADTLGVYSAATNLSGQIFIFTTAFTGSLMPLMGRLHAQSRKEEITGLLHSASKLNFCVLFPVLLAVMGFADRIMLLFGRDYASGADVLRIMGGAWLLYFMKGPFHGYLQMTGRQGLEAVNTYIGLSVGVLVSFLAVAGFGVTGIAAGAATGILVIGVLEVLQVRRLTGASPFGWITARVAAIHCAYLMLLALCVVLEAPLFLAAATALYPLALYAWGLTEEERDGISSWLRSAKAKPGDGVRDRAVQGQD
jgi:O-antigen/teichoic acid export membrane protein